MNSIVISQRMVFDEDRCETRDVLDHRLINLVSDGLGCLPFPLPNSLGTKDLITKWIDAISPLGIIISGGGDIGADKFRDNTEHVLIDYALENNIPVLGICRGMQLLATFFGGGLYPVVGHVASRHRVIGSIDMEVNSYHNYSLKECPIEFEVTSYSADGNIESIRHRTAKLEAWMWHPEREVENYDLMLSMIKKLFHIN